MTRQVAKNFIVPPPDPDEPIIVVSFDSSTGVTTVTIPALSSQGGKPTVIKFDPGVTEAFISATIHALLGG